MLPCSLAADTPACLPLIPLQNSILTMSLKQPRSYLFLAFSLLMPASAVRALLQLGIRPLGLHRAAMLTLG